MIVTHIDTGRILTPGVDYVHTHRFNAASEALTEQARETDPEANAVEVFGSITILNRDLNGTMSLEYQTLGGAFSFDEKNLLVELLTLLHYPDTRSWENVMAIPSHFPPVEHEVHIDDLVGMAEVHSALLSLVEAVKGNGEGNHMHPISHIKGLQDILNGFASNDGNHKVAVGGGHALINHTGPIAVKLPEFVHDTKILLKVTLLSNKTPTQYEFSGTIANKFNANTGDGWENAAVTFSGYEHTNDIRLTYDLEDRPVVYIGGAGHLWTDALAVITEVTIDGNIPKNYNYGWSVFAALQPVGPVAPMADTGLEEFKLDFNQTGSLKPWSVWLINSNQVRERPLPSDDVEDGAEIIIRDSVGRCFEFNATIAGSVQNQADLIINRNKAWVRLKFSKDQNSWFIMEGHAGTIYQGDGSLYLPTSPDQPAPVVMTDAITLVDSNDLIVDDSYKQWTVKRLGTLDAEILLKDVCPVGTLVHVDNVLSTAGVVTLKSETGAVTHEDIGSSPQHTLTGKGQIELLKVDTTNWLITDVTR
jgi:hypothetical protein